MHDMPKMQENMQEICKICKKYAQYHTNMQTSIMPKKYAKYAKKHVKFAVYVNHFPICKKYANYALGTLLMVTQ